MATPATVNPFNFYPGRDGLPLQNGYLYFGEPFQDPELQPLQAYWDDANTQPAARPIRTINGYPARNGAPSQVFVGAQYSMRVRDSQGREVFYAPNVTAVDLGGGGLDIITASGGQTVVTLTNAVYTPGSNAIDIALNGIIQISGQDYFETGTDRITMASALSAGDQIRAFARSTFGLTQAVLSDWQAEVFNGAGGGSQNFVLTRSPGAVANLDVSVTTAGVGSTLRPLIDYTLSGNTVTITPAPAVGTNNVLIRYGRSLPQDALRGELASTASAADGDGLVGVLWTGTPGVATTQHQVNEDRPTMMMSLADSLKAAIRALTSTVDISSQMQSYLQYCYDNNKDVVFPPGQYTIAPISLSATGGELSGGMKWTGAGKNTTIIKQSGASSTPLITITGSGNPTTASIMFRDMSIVGNGKTCSGLKLDKIAGFHFDNFNVRDFDIGIELSSALIGSAINTSISRNNTGVRSRQNGVNAFCNLLTFGEGCQIIFNTTFGLDIGACDTLNVGYGCQLEQNGTPQTSSTVTVTSASPAVVTWNSHGLVAGDPVIFTNSGGALPTGITADYIYYVIASGLTTNTFQFSATVGGSAVNTSSTGTGTHTASSPKTGGIVIRKTVVDELGAVTININAARFEGNHGCDFRSEYMSTAFGLYVNFTDCLMAGTSDGPMIAVGFARKVVIRGSVAPVGSSTWNVNTDQLLLENSKVINLRRPGGANTDTIVINSGFGGPDYVSGETGSYTATLTGCTTSPTATITYTVQGKEVTLNVAAVTATSNTTAATLTGMPAASSTVPNLFPSVKRNLLGNCTDSGVEKVSPISVETTGVITLNNAFAAFAASGTKGVGTGFTVKYER